MADQLLLRRTNQEEVEFLVKIRMDFCSELHPEINPTTKNDLERKTREYFQKALRENSYRGYAGFLGDTLCCGAGVLIYSLPPWTEPLQRKCGHVLNFFVYPSFRKQGIGSRLMQYIIDDTTRDGFARLVLNATDAGERVYRKHGFHDPDDTSLILELHKPLSQ
ncbi:MAG TPA: GNAT family N-acetyltransferase [Bacteroidota bacterium]|nr:GNAT family N-acetyltransferase [Bacteroidota bacterium]